LYVYDLFHALLSFWQTSYGMYVCIFKTNLQDRGLERDKVDLLDGCQYCGET